jgi:hypothetical protein
MTPERIADLRRFTNEGFPAVGRLIDAYEAALRSTTGGA